MGGEGKELKKSEAKCEEENMRGGEREKKGHLARFRNNKYKVRKSLEGNGNIAGKKRGEKERGLSIR